jgi:hypothetical protein
MPPELSDPWKLSSIQKASLFEPNERRVLWLIANDPSAFGLTFNMELVKKGIVQPNTPNSNIAKGMAIYLNLVQKKYIVSINHDKNKVTWKGNFYRLYTHPSLLFWGTVIGLFAVIVTILLAALPKMEQNTEYNKPVIVSDSLSFHKKTLKDSVRKK